MFGGSLGKALSPTSGWANPMSYGFKTIDVVSGKGSSSGSSSGESFMDFIPGIGDARAQERANQQNLLLDQLNRQWMERMSNTAYQRGMEDMKKAGLNPMLAYQQGGASVPSSQAPTVQAASKTGLANSALQAYTGISAAHTQRLQAQTAVEQAQSSIQLQASQTAKEIAETRNIEAETQLKQREIRGKGVKDTLDREGGRLIQKMFDHITNSAKDQKTTKEKIIKVLGIETDPSKKPLIKKPQ